MPIYVYSKMITTAGKLTDDTRSILHDLLRRIYGFDVMIANLTIVNQHHDYVALLADIKNPALRLAIKLAGKDAPYHYPFDRTAYFHRLVATRTTIPMPTIIAVDVSYYGYPWRYLIKDFITGEEWIKVRPTLAANPLRRAYEQIGDAVAQLHQITFEQFGDDHEPYDPVTNDFYELLLQRVDASLKNVGIKRDFLKLLETNQSLFIQVKQPRLCHEDLHHHNILFGQQAGQWELATILDFDKAWAGHHEIDLAKMALWDDMVGDGFWDRYRKLMPIDDLYEKREPIYQLWWCLEYAANTPKHLADTRQLCNLLGFPPIERFE
jgi:fructosamine-3-kinase